MLALAMMAVVTFLPPAEEGHQHGAAPDKLGTVHFPISCRATARAHFDRGLALLHSFWYTEADAAFTRAATADRRCGIAQWGVAMSQYYQFWEPPTAAALAKGAEAATRAAALGAPTERERDFIAAIGAFYKDHGTSDHRARAKAYEKAMEELYRKHPDDLEVAAFYGLALLSTRPLDDKTHAQEIRAAEVLEPVFTRQPSHPGAPHYIIHSFDSPDLAARALPAALAYSKIAPVAPHALHMPSHIFVRLGRWEDSVQSNLASSKAARAHAEKTAPGATSFDDLHALDYLEYAYLQRGQEAEAKAVVERVRAVTKLDKPSLAAFYALAAVPARFALERRRWADAGALTVPAEFDWSRYPWAEAIIHFAKGVGGARSGNLEVARAALARLEQLRQATPATEKIWGETVEAQRGVVAAWVSFAEGRPDDAVAQLRAAADLEDKAEKHPVTPGAPLPARELLADMLLEAKRPAEALAAYETALRAAPNRFNAVFGAARAASEAGDREKARAYYASLLKLSTASADAKEPRPELAKAHAFLKEER